MKGIQTTRKRLFLIWNISLLLTMLFTVHLFGTVGIASLNPGYNGEAEFNTWEIGATGISFPFINTRTEWKWQTEIVVQNVGAVSNTISFKYYDFGGSLVGDQSIQLNPGANQTYSPPTNFSGSLLVTGTQPLTAMAIGANLDPAWSGDRLISYKGVQITSGINHIQLYPIQRNNNGWNSILAVQNQEGLGPASITLNFTNLSNGLTTTLMDTLPAYSSKFYDISGLAILGDSFSGSVGIQADQTVTGVVISTKSLSGGGAFAHNPIWSGASPPPGTNQSFFPRIGSESILAIHNLSSTTQGFYIVRFFDMNGVQYFQDNFSVPAGGYFAYPCSGIIPSGVLVSAVINSDQMMAAIVSTKWPNPPLTSTGYNGIISGSTIIYVPFVSKEGLNTITRIGVQNLGTATTDVAVIYSNGATETATIPPGASHDFDQSAESFLPDGFKGSAVIYSVPQPIAAVGFISRNIVTPQPNAFSKSSPANGAPNQSTSPTLTWGVSTGATSYEYCNDTSDDNACSSWTSNNTSTSASLSGLANNTTYYWQVRALNEFGITEANGGWWSFTTRGPLPGGFTKVTPMNGATEQPSNPILTWGVSTGATSYEYCYDTNNDNACSSWTSSGTSTSASLIGLVNGTTYYWQVRATNTNGTTYANGTSNAFWSFTTTPNPPAAFNKISPASGATNQFTSPTLTWGASTGATSYEYCYDTTNDDACSTWTSNGTSTSASLSGLANGITYYWQVRAINAGGTTYADGSATAFWSFTTIINPPVAFSKTSPANGDIIISQPTSPNLTWSAGSGASSYEYCYDTFNDNACSSWTTSGTSNSASLSGLSYGTTYYWQVRAINAGGTTYADGSATAFWSFSTLNPPAAFNKSIPVNGAINQSISPTLTWGASTGASSYQYCYDTTNDNACDSGNWAGIGINPSVALSGLTPGTTYYWQVRAFNISAGPTDADEGTWWSFTTSKAVTAPVVTTNTANGITTSGATLNGMVNANNGTTIVTFQYGLGTAYGITVTADQSPVTGDINTPVSKVITGLSANTTYHYRVVAASSAGVINGEDQAFKTLAAPSLGGLIYLPIILKFNQ